jgi:asparagine synthase (glutamine-hydrolysing)
MCGFAGLIVLDKYSSYRVCENHLALMNRMLLHRGPDDQRIYIDHKSQMGFAFSRLALADSANGMQPMHSSNYPISLVYNGEIYGYDKHKSRLKAQGVHFRSRTDTEVLLKLYEDQGISCLDHLNGEFAFVIHDGRSAETFIVRDRLGAKPLYYTIQKGIFFFASEIKALLCHPYVQASLNCTTVYQQMMRADSSKKTFIEEIEILPPGSYLMIKQGIISKKIYWRPVLPSALSDMPQEDIPTAAHKVKNLVESAVQRRMKSDFEIGSFLSGGLDSSIICAVMQRCTAKPITTFSLCFEDTDYDESYYSRQVAAYLGTDHHEVRVSNLELTLNLPKTLFYGEYLTQSMDGVGRYLLAQKASNYVKAVMTGEGADELFLGYPCYKTIKTQNDWDEKRAYYCRELIEQRETTKKGFDLVLSNHTDRKTMTQAYGYYPISVGNIQEMEHMAQGIFSEDFLASMPPRPNARAVYSENMSRSEVLGLTPIDQNRLEFMKTTLPSYLLQYLGGKMEMAHSLEGRLPFLDRYVVDYALSLPNHYHLFGMIDKNLLRLAFKDILPPEIFRRPKHGYAAPVLRPFWANKHPEFFDFFLSKHSIQEHNIFSFQAVRGIIQRLKHNHFKGQAEILAERAVMFVLSTSLLYDMFIARKPCQLPTYQ